MLVDHTKTNCKVIQNARARVLPRSNKGISMIMYIAAYAGSALVFFVLDFIWLSQVALQFYSSRLGDLLLEKPNIGAAAIFYLMYVAGIVIFAVSPALRADSIWTALMFGALFGFFAYATYDMTNYATLKNWPLTVVIVDITWGTCLTALSAAAGYLGTKMLVSG